MSARVGEKRKYKQNRESKSLNKIMAERKELQKRQWIRSLKILWWRPRILSTKRKSETIEGRHYFFLVEYNIPSKCL